jgi:hypothetical protein
MKEAPRDSMEVEYLNGGQGDVRSDATFSTQIPEINDSSEPVEIFEWRPMDGTAPRRNRREHMTDSKRKRRRRGRLERAILGPAR